MKCNLTEIENISELEAGAMSLEKTEIKGHNIYFADLGDIYGYSCLVFKNNHSIHYANDYELHHTDKTRKELRDMYINKMNNILFTEMEIVSPLKDYSEYKRKINYLLNYYGMQVDYVSAFCSFLSKEQIAELHKKIKGMFYNPIAYAYMAEEDFVKHHIELFSKLEKAKDNMADNYAYLKGAFLYEMYNHEYDINWQADYDVLSEFGDVTYNGEDLNAYFKELKFTDLQKQAYCDAMKQYYSRIYL